MIPDNKMFLEVGCFEGRATCWMLENMLADNGSITCIDTFEGSEEHTKLELGNLQDIFVHNIETSAKLTQHYRVMPMTSYEGLARLIGDKQQYDFIYIDGSHTAPDVMTDACMAFGLLKQGGIMLFDDYLWKDMPGVLHRPKLAIDLFVTLFSEQCDLAMIGYQLAVKKL
ncbi:methyltransferase domain [Bacteriophage sp.]|nr:methyltransferase domain [Bacteriophage sp.]